MIVAKRRRDTARLLTVFPDSQSCNGPGTYDGTAETKRTERDTLVNFPKLVAIKHIRNLKDLLLKKCARVKRLKWICKIISCQVQSLFSFPLLNVSLEIN